MMPVVVQMTPLTAGQQIFLSTIRFVVIQVGDSQNDHRPRDRMWLSVLGAASFAIDHELATPAGTIETDPFADLRPVLRIE